MISVLIVDADEQFRDNIAEWIHSSPEHTCVGTCGSSEEAVHSATKLAPDVVLMDTHLPRMSGISCIAHLRSEMPHVRVIMFTVHKDKPTIFQALRAGVSGYILKGATREELMEAITDAQKGGTPVTAEVVGHILEGLRRTSSSEADFPKISPRESEVLHLLASGMATKQIADHLGISYETVCVHLRRLYGKLNVRTRTEAVIKHLRAQSVMLDSMAAI